MKLKTALDYDDFVELNKDEIYDRCQTHIYETWRYWDDYDVQDIEVPDYMFDDTARDLRENQDLTKWTEPRLEVMCHWKQQVL